MICFIIVEAQYGTSSNEDKPLTMEIGSHEENMDSRVHATESITQHSDEHTGLFIHVVTSMQSTLF